MLVVAVVLLGGCGGDDGPSGGEKAIGATSKLSDHDAKIITDLGGHTSRWNEVVGPFIRDYIDQDVDADAWLASTGEQLRDLRVVVVRLETDVLGISDKGVRAVFGDIAANYKRKLAAATGLVAAVKAGDTEGEQAAAEELSAAAEEGQQLASSLIDRLRPYVDPEDLSRMLGDKAQDLEDLFGGD